MVGHTHEDIDQHFSCLSRYLKKNSAVTLEGIIVSDHEFIIIHGSVLQLYLCMYILLYNSYKIISTKTNNLCI